MALTTFFSDLLTVSFCELAGGSSFNSSMCTGEQ
jgi:hypothetical protein